MANGVKRIPVKEGRIRGTLFLPPGEGPFPAVIKLYGGIHKGQVIEDKAALMASRGFVTLSLAFFGVDDLPKSYVTQPLELDYFEEAVDYMLSLEKTKKNSGLGVVAMSKGGEIALSMAAHFPPGKVAAVVAINSFITVCVTDAVYKGQVVQKGYQFYMGEDAVVQKGPNLVNLVGVCRDMAVRGVHAVIPFWNSEVNILLQAVEDDQCCDSQQSLIWAKKLIEAARQGGEGNRVETELYLGAGHLIDLPFSPPTTNSTHPMVPRPTLVDMGGAANLKSHEAAQVDMWQKTLEFLRKNL